ncbi:uncharacterized protein F5147DRAFT_713706 [Suillus discolor]|uniref:Uncharacterized protein n=1 Tax=Suillus discolor TaxID=1912936 RepID=A0A9P7F0E9_9AGAM|nr:uncharacterized protein F5147DRAFT_713706 [Suillus discolor]KAG2098757.1 hypothetical protein F5147DRAFT_713706 [Suillus discolor]
MRTHLHLLVFSFILAPSCCRLSVLEAIDNIPMNFTSVLSMKQSQQTLEAFPQFDHICREHNIQNYFGLNG